MGCDASHSLYAKDPCDVTINDMGVDVKCEIMLANHNKSQQLIISSDVSRDPRPTNHTKCDSCFLCRHIWYAHLQ